MTLEHCAGLWAPSTSPAAPSEVSGKRGGQEDKCAMLLSCPVSHGCRCVNLSEC